MSPGGGCPICREAAGPPAHEVQSRRYLSCARCGLIWMAPEDRLPHHEERARYETHRNSPSDEKYRAFLDRLCRPLVRRLPPAAEGLDFGSGPGPTLSVMLEERGFSMRIYDPYFAPDPRVLERDFDFITCTETVEHFFEPGEEFRRLDRLLRPGGWLGVMTDLVDEGRPFESWHYVRDPTHVAFYRRRTLEWLADALGWSVEFPSRTVALFRKPEGEALETGGAPAPDSVP